DRRVAEIAAAGGEQVAGEAVVGLVGAEGIQNPVVVGLGGIGPEVDGEFGFDAEEVAPPHGAEFGELVAVEEAVDEGGALVGVGVGEEAGGLLGGGESADGVEVGAAEERAIGGGVGGL